MPGQALAPQGFPGIVYIKRGGIHRAPAIVNDAVRELVSNLYGFQQFKAEPSAPSSQKADLGLERDFRRARQRTQAG